MLESIIKHITGRDPNENLAERALDFAKAAHEGQKRVSREDYITHPVRTAQILKELHLDEKTIAAGLLHDVPDDTQRTLKDIEKEFGKEVAFLVDGVSKLGKLRYPKSGISVKPIEKRIEEPVDLQAENLRKMFFAMAQDLRVVLIKLADRLHNMETLGSLPPERQKRIALETLEIFAPLANRLGIGDVKGKLEDLSFPYLYPKEYEWLMSKVKDKYGEREKYIHKLKPAVQKILAKEGIKPIDIHSRAKHYWSLYQKLLRYDMSFDKMYDLVALRIIVNNIEDCYKVLGAIHRVWKPMPGLIKDYIAFPKPNNYRSVHTTCFCLDGKLTEFQIKTPEMHEKAEHGIAAHWAYKEGINLKMQRRQFAWVAQLSNWQKNIANPQEYLEGLKIDFFKNRIFVLTPKGDVMDLPEGACSIDFAYAVHSDIGNKCAGAKINGKMAMLAQQLKNGDMVEIITEKNKKPSRNWLEFVKTAVARSRIREQLKKELGREEIDRREILKAPIKQEIIKIQPAMKEKISVFLAGQTGMQNYLAQCCSPQLKDNIRAYVTKNRGASIHKDNCPSILRAEKKWPQKIIEASWQNKKRV